MASLAQLCIRCGSKDHTTRDHDEGKAGAAATLGRPATGKTRPASAKLDAAEKKEKKPSRVQHPTCWNGTVRNAGIPDVIDKPLRDRFYTDRPAMNWSHRASCDCQHCEKLALRKSIQHQRRFGSK